MKTQRIIKQSCFFDGNLKKKSMFIKSHWIISRINFLRMFMDLTQEYGIKIQELAFQNGWGSVRCRTFQGFILMLLSLLLKLAVRELCGSFRK